MTQNILSLRYPYHKYIVIICIYLSACLETSFIVLTLYAVITMTVRHH